MFQEVRERMLAHHRNLPFRWYNSFPLRSDDTSVLFTNATITPFKRFFSEPQNIPHNYALIQTCLRVGGGAGQPEYARTRPNYSSLFEMFGSGMFGGSLQ